MIVEVFGGPYALTGSDSPSFDTRIEPVHTQLKSPSVIELRDYQRSAYESVLSDFADGCTRCLIVLATGLGKTILFSKIIQGWKGRCLVLVEREELLQNAYQEIEAITGEILGIERASEYNLGERIVVATVQTLSRKVDKFSREHFSLIIVDECHHAASESYIRILDHFKSARVIGLTATDGRADGQKLPFEKCSYRMGIREGIESGYLVPIRGRRVVIDSVNLTRVKLKKDGDFDDSALDDEMVKGASAIADVILSDFAFDKGILFFPGCASARLTSEILNKRLPSISVYVDGTIVGKERRSLISSLREGRSNWLCNVGIATEGFNWTEAAVVGMCCPTTSRAAYVQRAGRGTRPLSGLLNGLGNFGIRQEAIAKSSKPYMTILDFVGVSANLNLISHESFLEPEPEIKEKKDRAPRQEDGSEKPEELDRDKPVTNDLGRTLARVASGVQSVTVHSTSDFDPFEASGVFEESVSLKTSIEVNSLLTEKQARLLSKYGVNDSSLTKAQAQKLVNFVASKNFRLNNVERTVLGNLYTSVKRG